MRCRAHLIYHISAFSKLRSGIFWNTYKDILKYEVLKDTENCCIKWWGNRVMLSNATLHWQNFWTGSFLRLASCNFSQKAVSPPACFTLKRGKKKTNGRLFYANSEKAETLPEPVKTVGPRPDTGGRCALLHLALSIPACTSASCGTWLLREGRQEGCSGGCSRWKVQEGCGFIWECQEAFAGRMLIKAKENGAK